ncbi:MAG: hypothetical protein E6H96_07585 [Chloroflexi bacterium]|jgi:hypothetical protein|nr:MAG: hypothetical protein E6H96_07585 [Chloroflexota bacterium]
MSLPTRTNRTPDEEQVLKHVIAEYKHRAQTVTCVCGWHGSTLTTDGRRSEWTDHLAANRPARN